MAKRVCAICNESYEAESQCLATCPSCRGKVKRQSRKTPHLTPRQRQVVKLVAEGLQNKEIASRLLISSSTVAVYLSRIYKDFLTPEEKSSKISRVALVNKWRNEDLNGDVETIIKTAR